MKSLAIARITSLLAASVFLLNTTLANASSTDIANTPVVTSDTNSTPVPPNIMFIVDDSGSMDWDFLPDWSNDYYCKRASGSVVTSNTNDSYSINSLCCRNRSGSGNDACMYGTSYGTDGSTARRGDVPFTSSDFNNAYYNPSITYTPPKNSDGTSKTSQTCSNSGGTVSGTNCTTGWASVQLDAYAVQELSTTTLNLVTTYPDVQWCSDSGLTDCRTNSNYFYPNQVYKYFKGTVGNPFYYTIVPGEYCDSEKLTSCTTAAAATGSYTFPAKLRWCSDTALTTCQAIKNATYKYPRYPTLMPSNSNSGSVTTVFTVTGNSTATSNKTLIVNSIAVATGPAIVSAATAITQDVDTATDRIIANMVNGYLASAKTCTTSGSTRTCTFAVMAPATGTCPSGAITPSLTTGAAAGTAITVAATPQFTNCRTPGNFTRVDIVSNVNTYPYPGQAIKASTRTDCAGTTCTYLEEMTNFANWFTYYRTRMQMMKSASSLAFSGIGDSYRVGYMSINNNNSGKSVAGTSGDFLNISTFDATQKTNWYNKLFSANPNNGTPLRSALSTAGLIYGGVLNGSTFNGSTVSDPVLYSCQKHFAILSTDGYWNTGNDSGCSSRTGQGCKLDRTSAVGNTDGVSTRPYSDGAVATITDVTPISTVVRKQSIQNSTTTTPWSRVVTTQGAVCTVSVAGPAGSCLQDNGKNSSNSTRTWCMEQDASHGNECTSAFGTAAPRAYACRGGGNATNKPGGIDAGCITDGAGVQWCLYNGNSTAGTSSCTRVLSANSLYVCKRNAAVSGTTVTTQNQSYNQIVVGPQTLVTDETTSYNRTVVKTNGVVTSDTNSTSSTSTSTVSSSVAPTSDTGAPGGGTAWVNGTSSSACMETPTAAGTSAPAAGTSNTVLSGSATVSTLSTTGPTAGTTTTTGTATGGVSDSLADVAFYYYSTDLRAAGSTNATSGVDVGTGDLDSTSGTYTNSFQRMNTYTLGLGIDGYMKFRGDYATASSGDYYDVANGVTSSSSRCNWQGAGSACNWPAPSSDSQANIDDLWHAAVNGRGAYFSAQSPAELSAGLSSALSSITAKVGAAAAATTSNPNITSGDNFLFSSDFTTKEWTSKLERLQIDPTTGNIITTTNSSGQVVPVVDWNAQTLLDAKVTASSDSRTIFTFTSDTTQTSFCGTAYLSSSKLKPFCWSGSSNSYPADTSLTTAEQTYFTGAGIASMPQLCATGTYTLTGDLTARNCLSTAQQTDAGGKNLINFLRGQTGNEDQSSNALADRYYRDRTHALGDIVASEAVYVKAPLANYSDTGFLTFKAAQASNPGMVYVASNDGMLHAFNATNGTETWAFIPTMVMPKMFNLASTNYGSDHKFLLDGTPVVDYAYIGGAWKTILVGGLSAGGAGYYALDITNPTTPQGLWEFKQKTTSCATTVADAVGQTADCDLGYSFGNPIVTKLTDGTWVVLVTSGYNNTTPGNGQGYLYVLNAATGAIINKIGTGVGGNSAITGVCTTAPCPSGLGKIAAWVDSPDVNNTTKRVYGGDLFGNLWRFDINNNIGAAGYDAQQLAILKGPNSVLQPVTERPELGESNGIAIVLVGTGRLMGDSDKSDVSQTGANRQSFYAIKDPLTATGWGDVRTAGLIQQTLTVDASTQSRTGTSRSVPLASVPGWFIDFPDAGERSYTDPALALGTIAFTTNLPTGTACSSSGQSFIYFLDYRSGAPVLGAAGYKLGNSLATRPVIVQLEGGAVRSITRLSDTSTDVRDVPIGSGSTTSRRVSWRQLLED